MDEPTILRVIGFPIDIEGRRINLRRYGLKPIALAASTPASILVVGSSMDAGKTASHLNDSRWFIASSAKRHRRQVRTIRLD